jgi:hypothetical protein
VVTFLSLDPLLGVCKPAGTHVYIEFLCWVILSYAELYWVMMSYAELYWFYHVYDLRIYWCRVCVDTMQGLTCVCTCCSVGSVHPQHSQ